jgi:hypothetical protein
MLRRPNAQATISGNSARQSPLPRDATRSLSMTNDLVRTVWAANELPNPSLDLRTVQGHLGDLTISATRSPSFAPSCDPVRRKACNGNST